MYLILFYGLTCSVYCIFVYAYNNRGSVRLTLRTLVWIK